MQNKKRDKNHRHIRRAPVRTVAPSAARPQNSAGIAAHVWHG